jgi:hypothetical protein
MVITTAPDCRALSDWQTRAQQTGSANPLCLIFANWRSDDGGMPELGHNPAMLRCHASRPRRRGTAAPVRLP